MFVECKTLKNPRTIDSLTLVVTPIHTPQYIGEDGAKWANRVILFDNENVFVNTIFPRVLKKITVWECKKETILFRFFLTPQFFRNPVVFSSFLIQALQFFFFFLINVFRNFCVIPFCLASTVRSCPHYAPSPQSRITHSHIKFIRDCWTPTVIT